MSACVEQQRVGCAIGGIYTALAIDRVMPILHSGPGCQDNAGRVVAGVNGGQSMGPISESIIPCTDFCEADVIFGGEGKLKKLIEKSIEYLDSDLFLVVDGCTAEIVGDDIEDVTRSFQGGSVPVIYSRLPGFKGNNLWGHSQVLQSIIEQYLTPSSKRTPRLVNVWGIVPYYDTMWAATLEKVAALLRELGLEPNIIYGQGSGVARLSRIPEAEFNLLLSPWVDLDVVQLLREKFGIPYFHYPVVPIGPTETTRFIRALADYAGLDKENAEAVIAREEERYYYYIQRHLRWLYACKALPKEFYINSSASAALALTRYLVNDLGLLPVKIYIVDNVPDQHQAQVREYFQDLELEIKDFEVVFTSDGGLMGAELKDKALVNPVSILGTAWDQLLATKRKITFVSVSAPYGDTLVGNKTYFGYDGAISLFADFYSDMVTKGTGSV
ncbi:Light-independent protochlorophyllide reductase subunit B [bioreactor metagenome]|uniref:Light-independent protochlorophyllide reductase subunit B n=1 Tax=bioreactor metagenome TaxID=1076179 RepID=A0A645A8R7_9ZZZZ